MFLGFSGIKSDLYRNALHHLDVVAGGIFRWKQAEKRPAGSSDALHVSVVLLPVSVHRDGRPLSWPHVAQLAFLEVGGHPDVVQVNDLHQFLADLHILANFNCPVTHDSADRSNHVGVLQVQRGLFQFSFLLLGLGQGGLGAGANRGHLLRRGPCGAQIGFGLLALGLGLRHHLFGGNG